MLLGAVGPDGHLEVGAEVDLAAVQVQQSPGRPGGADPGREEVRLEGAQALDALVDLQPDAVAGQVAHRARPSTVKTGRGDARAGCSVIEVLRADAAPEPGTRPAAAPLVLTRARVPTVSAAAGAGRPPRSPRGPQRAERSGVDLADVHGHRATTFAGVPGSFTAYSVAAASPA